MTEENGMELAGYMTCCEDGGPDFDDVFHTEEEAREYRDEAFPDPEKYPIRAVYLGPVLPEPPAKPKVGDTVQARDFYEGRVVYVDRGGHTWFVTPSGVMLCEATNHCTVLQRAD